MQMTLVPKNSAYIPSYKRTDITDDLHNPFGFHADDGIISFIFSHGHNQKSNQ